MHSVSRELCTSLYSITHLVSGPGDSETALSDCLKCLLKVPMSDSRLSRCGLLPLSVEPFSCTSSGFISFGLSSILTIVGFCRSLMSCVQERSVVGEDSDSGVKYAILLSCAGDTRARVYFQDTRESTEAETEIYYSAESKCSFCYAKNFLASKKQSKNNLASERERV
jgi:hypothetical protein